MYYNRIFLRVFVSVCLLLSTFASFAQITKVSGVITDAKTKQTLPFVGVATADTSITVTSDANGHYSITSGKSFSQIRVSYVGYKTALVNLTPGKEQNLDVR